jgi:CRISPR-associated endonuclease/helicase Cas3
MSGYFAHTHPDGDLEWEPLEGHLSEVADLARSFASAFTAGDAAYVAGLWHDLGKFSRQFQNYLRASSDGEFHSAELAGKVDHSTAGAQHANAAWARNPHGKLLAYCIAGHHAGLPDDINETNSCLRSRLKKEVPAIDSAPAWLLEQPPPSRLDLREVAKNDDKEKAFQAALYCRMLFSCLVDADFLATERFMAAGRAEQRLADMPSMAALEENVLQYLRLKMAAADPTTVNQRRSEVLDACLGAAESPPGLFSLKVPTGGGKTLASLAFALRHARRHGLNRIIYAIPFTSIIEQNADVFRDAVSPLGSAVVEHHSNLDPLHETTWSRLAAENWDAPVIVTTNVQLFESLFAATASRCRKLHSLVGSVIVLDEVQTLPVEFLAPCLAVLRELARNYGCTVVLCTATQPAIELRDDFSIGLAKVRPIIAEPQQLAADLRRVHVQHLGRVADEPLIRRLADESQVLCIVNTKAHAASLFRGLSPAGAIHLSANMCPRHRRAVLRAIRRKLRAGRPCRVVSTQVVEAGVDLDFPVVYRALTGLDSIAQAAGRCDREGRLTAAAGRPAGRVYVFEPEHPIPKMFAHQAHSTTEVIDTFPDLLGLDAIEAYFRLHYWKRKQDWDRHDILGCFELRDCSFAFRTCAERFRMIADDTTPVIIPYGYHGRRFVDRLRRELPLWPERRGSFKRRAQGYVVQLRREVQQKLMDAGEFEVIDDTFFILWRRTLYDRFIGVCLENAGILAPEESII